jgi:hypothetical protein
MSTLGLDSKHTFEAWKGKAAAFEGNKALFWAGRMSILVATIEKRPLGGSVGALELLFEVRREYDDEIIRRTDIGGEG